MTSNDNLINFSDIYQFQKLVLAEIIKSPQLQIFFKDKNPTIEVVDSISKFSSRNLDVEAIRILENTRKAFTPLYILKNVTIKHPVKESVKESYPGFCLIDWSIFAQEYKKSKISAQDLTIVKDFLRTSSEYFNRIAEKYEENSDLEVTDANGLIIFPIVYIAQNPGLVSINDASKYLGNFIANPNVAPLQVVYPKKDTDNIGLIVIKSAMTIAKLTYGVKGMRVQRSLKNAMSNITRLISGEGIE